MCRAPAIPTTDSPARVSVTKFQPSFLPANRAGKKMRIQLANLLDLGRDRDVLKTRASKCLAPLLGHQKTGIRANLRIKIDIGETLQDLEHQLGINRLVGE